ncbi:MAG: nucleotide exchange factor GrpE [Actinomycetota bacterium]
MSKQSDFPRIEIVEAEVLPEEEIPTAQSLGLDLPDEPDEALPLALTAVAEARQDADQYLDDLRRVAADFDNYRKRSQRELAGVLERAAERVVRELLPVLDSFDAAMATEPRSETEEKLLAGMRSTHAQLLDALAKEGLQPIPSWDETFDPEIHEAVMTTGEGNGPLIVTEELRRGYRLRGKVLRAALVAVTATEAEERSPEE